ncbi:methyltransferase family protein [Longispora albida]|uniref:methyltransferase family protein n=1 Tax=Longispora albida TaxID=203523 RepID=UPI000378D449|nr:isoprenylcysteine carboxylmethyltransferase family protein [Longispora albida]
MRERLSNLPLPEQNLAVIAAGAILHRLRPLPLPGSRRLHRLAGWSLITAGAGLATWSWVTAGRVHLAAPDRLVTTGPYARSRNPMYLAWALIHLGTGLATGSTWTIAGLPASCWWISREVRAEEQALAPAFGTEYDTYRARVSRWGG